MNESNITNTNNNNADEQQISENDIKFIELYNKFKSD